MMDHIKTFFILAGAAVCVFFIAVAVAFQTAFEALNDLLERS